MKIKLCMVWLLLTISLLAQDIRQNNWGDTKEKVITKEGTPIENLSDRLIYKKYFLDIWSSIEWSFAFNKLHTVSIKCRDITLDKFENISRRLIIKYGDADFNQNIKEGTISLFWQNEKTIITAKYSLKDISLKLTYFTENKKLQSSVQEWDKEKEKLQEKEF